jgi:hypothetical protein
MSWVNPIIDRTSADILARTVKAFMNVADWTRIHGDTTEIQAQITSLLGLTVTLTTLTTPAITHFPAAAEINALIANIEAVRVGACLPVTTGVVVLKHDYLDGNGAVAPDYLAVNGWERNLSLLHSLLPNASDYVVHCGVANAGQPRFWQHKFR